MITISDVPTHKQTNATVGDLNTETYHFPNAAVLYPAAASLVAIPVMFRGTAAKPETGSLVFATVGSRLSGFTW